MVGPKETTFKIHWLSDTGYCPSPWKQSPSTPCLILTLAHTRIRENNIIMWGISSVSLIPPYRHEKRGYWVSSRKLFSNASDENGCDSLRQAGSCLPHSRTTYKSKLVSGLNGFSAAICPPPTPPPSAGTMCSSPLDCLYSNTWLPSNFVWDVGGRGETRHSILHFIDCMTCQQLYANFYSPWMALCIKITHFVMCFGLLQQIVIQTHEDGNIFHFSWTPAHLIWVCNTQIHVLVIICHFT